MKELVRRLSKGNHPVEVTLGLEKTVESLKESINRGMFISNSRIQREVLIWVTASTGILLI